MVRCCDIASCGLEAQNSRRRICRHIARCTDRHICCFGRRTGRRIGHRICRRIVRCICHRIGRRKKSGCRGQYGVRRRSGRATWRRECGSRRSRGRAEWSDELGHTRESGRRMLQALYSSGVAHGAQRSIQLRPSAGSTCPPHAASPHWRHDAEADVDQLPALPFVCQLSQLI